MENLNKNEIDYIVAKERVRQLKKFYESLGFYIIVLLSYGIWKYSKTNYSYMESIFLEFNRWNIVFWIYGIVLLLKAMKLFLFNQNWERRMMDKQLNK